jgi:hypothetical protein
MLPSPPSGDGALIYLLCGLGVFVLGGGVTVWILIRRGRKKRATDDKV